MLQLPAQTADFIIIGAGVVGTSIAFHLAKHKAGRIIIVDKDYVAQGATGRSSALIRIHYSFPPEVVLAVRSLEIFQNWKDIVGEPGEFRRTGFVRIVPGSEKALLLANVEMQKRCGSNVEVISCEEMNELEPDWNLDDFPALAYEPNAGYGDASIAANDFLLAARNMGVEYLPRTKVTRVLVNRMRVEGVETDTGKIRSPVVIAATGQWTRSLINRVGFDLPIEPELHYVAILKNPSDMKGAGCACIDSSLTVYFRSDGQDKTLVGDFNGERGVDIEGFPSHVNSDWFEEILQRASKRMPKLQDAEIIRGITGIYDMTPDARPIIGEIPEIEGLYVVAGLSGMGFKISPALGQVMSEILLDGNSKLIDVNAFRPRRFVEGQAIRAEYEYQND